MICSNCNSDIPSGYRFCLQCGSGMEEPSPTVKWTAPLVDTSPTNRATVGNIQSKPQISVWRILLYTVCGSVSIFGGLVLYNNYQNKNDAQEAKQRAQEIEQNNNSVAATKDARVNTPQSSVSPAQRSIPNSNSPPTTSASSSERIWYVMLGGYREPNWTVAENRLAYFQKQGFSAYIVDTNNYQNFDPDLHAIVMGPYLKDQAIDWAGQVKPFQSDVYIKWARAR